MRVAHRDGSWYEGAKSILGRLLGSRRFTVREQRPLLALMNGVNAKTSITRPDPSVTPGAKLCARTAHITEESRSDKQSVRIYTLYREH